MTRLEKLEKDVASLAPEELARFREWFAVFESDRFDAAIAEDAASGRLDSLADAALEDFRRGRTEPL